MMRSQPLLILVTGRRLASAGIAAAMLATGCVWGGWIPGERSWNPDIVIEPGDLSDGLALDAPFVGTLDCHARSCQKRLRIIVDQPGQLAVSGVAELASQDDQLSLVLEAPLGVLARASTGRGGPREDAPALAVSHEVERGTYFVLVRSIGGRIPFQLRAHLTPSEQAPAPEKVARVEPPAPEPLRKLLPVSLPGGARGGYDPSVPMADLRSFAFGPVPGSSGGARADTSLGSPTDLQIRRLVAEQLTMRGFYQAAGGQPADLLIAFSLRSRNVTYRELSPLYERYDFGPFFFGSNDVAGTRGTLTLDIIDPRANRIAWHATTTKPIGPGTAIGEGRAELVRQAVTEVLAGFPPR